VLAALAACGVKDPEPGKLDSSTIQAIRRKLAEIAAQANQAAPADVDENTRLEGARAGPGLRLTTRYTLVNSESQGINSATFHTKLVPVIADASCKNPDLRPLIDLGVVVVLEYLGSDGRRIALISIDRKTCGGSPVTATRPAG
jgi:hypothetical protein